MTLPNERYNAIKYTEDFLKELLDSSKTPRVPKLIRQRARSLLRHYPAQYHLDVLGTQCPSILETANPVDRLTQMVFEYEAEK